MPQAPRNMRDAQHTASSHASVNVAVHCLGAAGRLVGAVSGLERSDCASQALAARSRPGLKVTSDKSYLIPAAEIIGFDLVLSNFNRQFSGGSDHDVSWRSIGRNLRGLGSSTTIPSRSTSGARSARRPSHRHLGLDQQDAVEPRIASRALAVLGHNPFMDDLPLIDISALASTDTGARRALAAQIGAACREVGFFVITGHGVPRDLIDQTFAASARLFALPAEAKRAMAIDKLGSNRGYVGLGVEALDEKTAADHKEAFNLVWTDGNTRPENVWPALPGFREVVQRYFDAVLAVGRRLHSSFALDLGLPEDFFADKIDRPLATLRLLRYPTPTREVPSERIGAGTHTDYGNVTLLATDGVAGLQVRRRDGRWVDAPAVPGAFICNVGDCLMRWTNDIYVSTPHRVVRPAAERYSIALFVDPNPDALVSAIPSCVAASESPRYEPITANDYLQRRFASTYGPHG